MAARVTTMLAMAAALAVPRVAAADPPPTSVVRYDGHQVLRVEPADEDELAQVLDLADDVWTERVGLGAPVDIRISPQGRAALDITGISYEVRVADVQSAVDMERARLVATHDPASASEWFDDFRDWNAINAYMDTLAALDPELVTIESVGMSLEGREIRALRLNSPAATGKAAMIISGTMHAREWLSPMTVMCIAETLVNDYGADSDTTSLLDALDLVIVPVLNPDGYVYSWQAERYWRKNRRGGYGVDLNRNWDYQWGGQGASNNPNDENFHGEGPLSEPESQALASYIEGFDHAVAHLDFHSYSELILYPWGYQFGAAPDEGMLSMLAGQMSSAIQGTHRHYSSPIQGSDLYPAAGVVDDWSYGVHDMMSFTVELRGNDFVIPPSEIVPTCEENLAAVMVLAQWASEQADPVPTSGDDDGGASDDGLDAGDDDDASADGGAGDMGGDGIASDGGDEGPGGTAADGGAGGDGQPGALPPGFGGEGLPAGGCACTQGRQPMPPWWLMLGLLGLRRRRRAA
ncbi:MAG: M14 family metallocarboxypeptidase [Deltaproteobacteria bacterium]|nr:M14 family metallocarboxypeptidase [Deltaproteobacteria bacterium]